MSGRKTAIKGKRPRRGRTGGPKVKTGLGIGADALPGAPDKAALRESDALLSLFLRHSPIYAYIKEVTPDASRVLLASENFKAMVGIPGSAMWGKTMEELFPPEFAAKITRDDQAVVARGEVLKVEEELNGRHYSTVKFPIVHGSRFLLAGYTIDITERKQAELEREQFQTLFNISTDVMVCADPQGCFQRVNPATLRLLGYSEAELLAKPFLSFVHPDDRQPTIDEMARQMQTGSSMNFINRYRCKDGAVRWLSWRANYVAAEGITYATGRDITEQRQAEQELIDLEARYHDLYENAPDMYLSVDSATGCVIRCNQTFLNATGYTRDEVIGRPVFVLYQPESRLVARRAFEQFIATGSLRNRELIMKRKDGSALPVSLSASAVRDPQGRILHSRSTLRDITERKAAEAALRKSEGLFRAIADFSPDIISIFDREGRLVFNSPAAERIHGYQPGELENRSTFDFIHPEDRAGVAAAFGRLLQDQAEEVKVQYRYRNADGSYTWMEAAGRNELNNPQIRGIIAISRDISERKQAEADIRRLNETLEQRVLERTDALKQALTALQASEERFRAIATNTPDHILIQDRKLRYQLVINPQLGLTEAKMLGKTDRDLFRKADAARLTAMKKQVLATGKPIHVESSLPNLKGEDEFFEGDYIPKLDAAGKVDGLIGYFRNVTYRKWAENKLKESEEKFSVAFKNSPAPMNITRLESGLIVDANDAFLKITGYARKEVINATINSLGIWIDPQIRAEAVANPLKQRKTGGVEFQFRKKNGEIGTGIFSSHIIHFQNAPHILSAVNDITGRKQAEAALHESERLHRLLFTHSQDALMTVAAPTWKIAVTNPAAVKMFRAENIEQLLSISPWELSPPFQPNGLSSRQAAKIMIQKALQQGSHAFEWRHQRFDGEEFPASVLLARVEVAGRMMIQGTVRDLTERVRLEQEVLNISERERRRIAQDLHDGLGQLLVGASYLTGDLRQDLSEKAAPEARQLDRVQEVIQAAIAQARDLARGVQPVAPDPNGLMVALEKLAGQTRTLFGIRCEFKCRQPVPVKDNAVATHLFRIAQEAVTNAVKHGQAKRILIRLTRTPHRLKLAVDDDGAGIATRRRKKPGMGLSIMRYRAGIIGGTLVIQKASGGGTSVGCHVHLSGDNAGTRSGGRVMNG